MSGPTEDSGQSPAETDRGPGDQSDRHGQSPMSLAMMVFITSVVPP